MEPKYKLTELTQAEGDALTKEIMAVLEKYDAEIGVKSTIEILKRVPVDIPSPFMNNGDDKNKTEENTDSEAEASG